MPEAFSSAQAARDPANCAGSLLVISPHLDDAVFSCGSLLARRPGSMVVTVFTGAPQDAAVLTEWDRACGFGSAGEALRARHEENRRALGMLRCEGRSLDLLDCQYVDCPDAAMPRLTEALLSTVHELAPDVVAIPLGLFHGDHIRVSDAALLIWETWPGMSWFLYEDAPYRAQPGIVQQRLVQLHARGLVLTPAGFAAEPADKADAIAAYASQLKGFNGPPEDLSRPERYWRLSSKGEGP
ncbi:PIG-L family deacetylase [Achromobacter sp. ESBL13]|uniref:PIG-L family deacetylase n=1 Tax=Achromobacter sp. ESBL13 TaxID=3077328 RepID=UPI002FCB4E0D